jgi:hypothetical protein
VVAVLVVLTAIGVTLAVRAIQSPPEPEATTVHPVVPATPALVVGDHRVVTLVSLGGSRTDALLARVADDIGPAVAAVEGFWGTDWTREIVVIATDSSDQFTEQAGAGVAGRRADTAAVAVADRTDATLRTATGQRVVLAPGATAMSEPALRIVLAHELFHYASRTDTAAGAPRWLTEGVADYVARPAPDPALRASAAAATALPSDAEFTGDSTALSAAYDRSWLFARFVAERYGQAALRKLYLRACGAGHADLGTSLGDALGQTPAEVLGHWRGWAVDGSSR